MSIREYQASFQSNHERLFKVTISSSPFHGGNGDWDLPTKKDDGTWTPGEWRAVEGELEPCENGLHLCRESDLIHWLGPDIWLAEYKGERMDSGTKIVVRRARLLEGCENWNERTARLFACWCARQVWHLLDDDRSKNAVRVAEKYANGEATNEELAAAWDAAWAVWAARDAALAAALAADRDAARAVWAARVAARAAAWAAARDAAWDTFVSGERDTFVVAAWDAARDAARVAQTKCLMHVLETGEVS